jgi:hypothetical protein
MDKFSGTATNKLGPMSIRYPGRFFETDFLRVEYNVLSKNVIRDVSQSEKTLSEVI